MTARGERRGRDLIARHGETVFNAARVMQGNAPHTPLTRAGFAQADAMGAALRALLGDRPPLTMWVSPAGRTLQTLSIVAEHLGLDWRDARVDDRLVEVDVGSWSGRPYAEVIAGEGDVLLPGGVLRPAPDGERYPEVVARMTAWIADTDADEGDRLVIGHGMSSRVLRGLLTNFAPDPRVGAPIAPGPPQGSAALVEQGRERLVVTGSGWAPA